MDPLIKLFYWCDNQAPNGSGIIFYILLLILMNMFVLISSYLLVSLL